MSKFLLLLLDSYYFKLDLKLLVNKLSTNLNNFENLVYIFKFYIIIFSTNSIYSYIVSFLVSSIFFKWILRLNAKTDMLSFRLVTIVLKFSFLKDNVIKIEDK